MKPIDVFIILLGAATLYFELNFWNWMMLAAFLKLGASEARDTEDSA